MYNIEQRSAYSTALFQQLFRLYIYNEISIAIVTFESLMRVAETFDSFFHFTGKLSYPENIPPLMHSPAHGHHRLMENFERDYKFNANVSTN